MLEQRVCQNCGATFQFNAIPSQPQRGKFCSLACFHRNNVRHPRHDVSCAGCGRMFTPTKDQVGSRDRGETIDLYCSRACYQGHRAGEHNPHWRGGRVDSNGYKYLREKRHPASGYFAEHRKVAEQKVGRPLRPDEVVHHVNHDKTDNRPENLEVLTRSEHVKLHAAERRQRRA